MKSALVFTPKYSQDKNNGWLSDELIAQLELDGYEVTVFAIGDIELCEPDPFAESRTQYLFPTNKLSKYKKYLVLWPRMLKLLKTDLRKGKGYDLMISLAPLSIISPLIWMATGSKKITKKICILFDFFPIHQVQINLISSKFEPLFKKIESTLLNRFDIVTGMTPKNVEMIGSYYGLNQNKTAIKTLPLWGVKLQELKLRTKVLKSDIKMVFGGQIVPGRAIDKLIEMVLKIRTFGVPLTLTLFSTGRGFEELSRTFADLKDFILFKQRLPRNQYVEELTKYDIGAIVTDPRVTMPTFPSKIIDYMNCGIPCFCMIEKNSDIEEVIGNKAFLHVNHFDSSDEAVEKAIAFLSQIQTDDFYEDPDFYKKYTVEYAVKVLTD